MSEEDSPKRIHIKAVPWKTSLADRTAGAIGEPPAYVKRLISLERNQETLFVLAAKEYEKLQRFVKLRREQGDDVRLAEATERFNRKWTEWVEDEERYVHINAEIESFNKNYMLERQAALKYLSLKEVQGGGTWVDGGELTCLARGSRCFRGPQPSSPQPSASLLATRPRERFARHNRSRGTLDSETAEGSRAEGRIPGYRDSVRRERSR